MDNSDQLLKVLRTIVKEEIREPLNNISKQLTRIADALENSK